MVEMWYLIYNTSYNKHMMLIYLETKDSMVGEVV